MLSKGIKSSSQSIALIKLNKKRMLTSKQLSGLKGGEQRDVSEDRAHVD